MPNTDIDVATASPTTSKHAYIVATCAHIGAVISIIGTAASSIAVNQSLLNTAFGSSRGAFIAVILIAVSHVATRITAFGAPADGAAVPTCAADTPAIVVSTP